MSIFEAFRSGIRNVNRTKRYIFMVYFINLFIAFILGGLVAGAIEDSVGSSLAGENLRTGFDDFWYDSFRTEASGLASTFEPGVVGIGAILKGLDAFLRGEPSGGYEVIFGVGIFFMIMWTFFSGGFISIYARTEERPAFLQQAARFFPRFLILFIMAAILYSLLFGFVMGWLSDIVNAMTRETIDERFAFVLTVIKYLILWALVWGINLLFDYSKIITVLQDHKNALTAPFKAIGIVFGNVGKTVGLYLTIGLVWVVLFFVYWLIAMDPQSSSTLIAVLLPFVLGQLYIISRIWTRCLFYGSQTALCETLSGNEQE